MDYWTPDRSPRDDDDRDADWSPPETEPSGNLSEPPRHPPTTVATAAASPGPRPPRPIRPSRATRKARVKDAVNAMLDILDGLGDAVRTAAARALR